jgi:Helix-turn-helix domain
MTESPPLPVSADDAEEPSRSVSTTLRLRDALSEVLTIEQVEAEYQIPRGTQANWRSRGLIAFMRLGGGKVIRYRRSDVEAYFASCAVPVRKAASK